MAKAKTKTVASNVNVGGVPQDALQAPSTGAVVANANVGGVSQSTLAAKPNFQHLKNANVGGVSKFDLQSAVRPASTAPATAPANPMKTDPAKDMMDGLIDPEAAKTIAAAAANKYQFGGENQDKIREGLQQGAANAAGREAPQMTAANAGAAAQAQASQVSGQFRDTQSGLANTLQDRIAGKAPSVAEMQLQKSTEDAIKAQQAIAASSRGPAGLANKNAANATANLQADAAGSAAMLRANEQAQAEQLLGNVSASARGQDIQTTGMENDVNLANAGMTNDVNLANANLAQDASKANLSADMTQQQQNDTMVQYYTSQGMSLEEAQLQANLALKQLAVQQGIAAGQNANNTVVAKLGADAQEDAANKALWGNIIGGGLAAAGTLGGAGIMASDERVKTNIKDGDDPVRSFLQSLIEYEYDYKQPEVHGEGKKLGCMAQDVEKTPVGKTMVLEVGGVKHLKPDTGVFLASLANLNKRLNELESKKKGK